MKFIKQNKVREDIADPLLFRLYWSLMMNDILEKNKWAVTKENKERLHEFHKKMLGYETIAGQSHEAVSRFLFECAAWWAVEKGIFVRTSSRQPKDIENRSFLEVKDLL